MVKILGWKCMFVLLSIHHELCVEKSNLPSQITGKGFQKGPEGCLVPMTVDKLSHNMVLRTSTT